jgi:PAS domain S-box-containing protein
LVPAPRRRLIPKGWKDAGSVFPRLGKTRVIFPKPWKFSPDLFQALEKDSPARGFALCCTAEIMNTDKALPTAPGESAREHLLQSIWDHSLDAILLTAPDGRIFAANPAACCLFDRTEAEICQLGRSGLLDLSDPNLAVALAERARMGQTRRELTFLRPDGSRFVGEVTSAVFTDSDGQAKTSMIIRDITARRQAAEQLQMMTLFPQHNPGPVLRVDSAGVVLMSNPAAATLGLTAGVALAEVIPMFRFLTLPAHIQAGTRFELEVQACDKYFLFTVQGLPAEEVALLYGTNITDRKRAEEALRESELKFRTIFELAPVGVSLLDRDHQFVACNSALEKITQLTKAELVAGTSRQRRYLCADGTPMPPDEFPSIRAVRENRVVQGVEIGIVMEDGRKAWVQVSAALLGLPAAHVLVLTQDITARKEAEAALRQSEEKFRTIFELAPVGISLLDEERRITDCNPALEKITRLTHAELLAGTHKDFHYIHGDGTPIPPAEWASVRALRENRIVENVEMGVVPPQGRTIWLLASAAPLGLSQAKAVLISQDITARKEAETALWENEQRLRVALALPDIAVFNQDLDLRYTWMFQPQLGYTVEQVVGKTDFDLMPWEAAEQATQTKREAVTGNCEVRREVRVAWQGGVKIYDLVVEPLRDATGAVVGITGASLDITARKEAEVALRQNEERLQLVLDATLDGLWDWDLRTGLAYLSPRYYEMTGYRPGEVTPNLEFYKRLVHPEDFPAVWHAMEAHLQGRTPQGEFDYRMVRKDGSVMWVLERGRVVERDPNGAPLRTVGTITDITARKEAEVALRQSEERLQLVLDATLDGIWDWDLRTGLAYLSPRYYEMTGYRPGEVTPNPEFYKRLIHPDDFPAAWRAMEEHLQGRTPQSVFDYRMIRKDGSVVWMFGRGRVVERDATGAPLRMAGTITDITARKRVEAELEASRKALRALTASLQAAREEERRHIARTVHDELGHAFTDLKLDLAWLDRRLAERKLTRRSALRRKLAVMSRQIEDSLHTARTLSTELRPAVLDSLGFVAALEWAMQQFAERTGIACKVELPPEPLKLDAKRSAALFRAFQELLVNIARHAQATTVRVRVAVAGDQVTLEVTDNGRGLTAQERDAPHALGLLGIRERALEFGGTAEFCAAPGGGTCVRICIPKGNA